MLLVPQLHVMPVYMQATIMTDPGTADRTYIGPMSPELVEEIIEKILLRLVMQLSGCRAAF